ncbi:hypothetical protein N657DRAFT_319557 [Parathielavia appendiculata]|uniref:Uncharacterized protein n=1 Tax=Parathielavia appendiculata TaxID=2587402 RepID=A0AAN6YZ88_9PEZI|nr:hypothetical protein N657DRAFT_319557 [Parathielavia appendiculata]
MARDSVSVLDKCKLPILSLACGGWRHGESERSPAGVTGLSSAACCDPDTTPRQLEATHRYLSLAVVPLAISGDADWWGRRGPGSPSPRGAGEPYKGLARLVEKRCSPWVGSPKWLTRPFMRTVGWIPSLVRHILSDVGKCRHCSTHSPAVPTAYLPQPAPHVCRLIFMPCFGRGRTRGTPAASR